jgi:hypothetical protein
LVLETLNYVATPCAVVWGLMLFFKAPHRVAVIGIVPIIGSASYLVQRES